MLFLWYHVRNIGAPLLGMPPKYPILEKMVKTLDPCISMHEALNSKSILLGVRLGQNEIIVNHLINIIKRYI